MSAVLLPFAYLFVLVVSIFCLLLCDFKWKLAFFYEAGRTAMVVAAGMLVFVAWDMLGINLGVFFPGDSRFDLDILLAPHFPLEELLFLFLLSYVALLIYRFTEERCSLTPS